MEDVKIKGLWISRIHGHARRTSNCIIDRNGQVYGEVRFSDGTKLKNLFVDGIMDGFVQANDEVTFYVGWFGKNPILIAVKDASGVIHEMDTTSTSNMKSSLIIQGIQPLFVGILSAIAGIGFLFIGYAIYLFMRARLLGRLIRIAETLAAGEVPSEAVRNAGPSQLIPSTA